MRCLSLCLCLSVAFPALCAAADLALSGKVVDENEAPVGGARIQVRAEGASEATVRALADPTGAFRALAPEAASYLISVQRESYFELTDHKIAAARRAMLRSC